MPPTGHDRSRPVRGAVTETDIRGLTHGEGPMKQHLRRRDTVAGLAAVAVSALVLYGSQQALSAAPDHPSDPPSHALTVGPDALTPGDTVVSCITVTSTVAGPAEARLRASVLDGPTGAAGADVLVRVEAVDQPAIECDTATTRGTVFDGPLADRPDALTQQHHDRSTTLSAAWSPDHTGAQQTYRLTLSLEEVADVTHETTPTVRFVWDVVPH